MTSRLIERFMGGSRIKVETDKRRIRSWASLQVKSIAQKFTTLTIVLCCKRKAQSTTVGKIKILAALLGVVEVLAAIHRQRFWIPTIASTS